MTKKKWSQEQKDEAVRYYENHTADETSEKFGMHKSLVWKWGHEKGNGKTKKVIHKSLALPVQINFCPSCGTRIPNACMVMK